MNLSSAARFTALSLMAGLALSPTLAQGQIDFPAPSPGATVKQTVGLTEI
ncbi:hypothetical protein N9K67_08010 [Opitutaceae bacterium]|jgi:hypothetical protein|nr:hypothetical protein [Opitutaceae bacterium]